MKLLLTLSWRNLWRNKRRLILTLAAVAFSVLATIAMRGVQLGTYSANIRNVVSMFSGYLQVQQKDYSRTPALRNCFTPDTQLTNSLGSDNNISSFSHRVYGDGLISRKDNSFGVAIMGLEPEREKLVTNIASRVHQGSFLETDSSSNAVLGATLLENLKAQIGDTILLLAQGYDGSLGNMKFRVIGTVKLGSPEMDAMTVFIGLRKSQELLALGRRIHACVISLKSQQESELTKAHLIRSIVAKNLSVLTWDQIMPEFKQAIELDNVGGILFLSILILIVAFSVLNTVLMSTIERYREYGVSLSVGMKPSMLAYLVFLETFCIAIMGVAAGNILGWVVNSYICAHPIQFSNETAKLYELYGFLPQIESSLNVSIFIKSSVSVLLISIAACIYPAYKVYRLEPLKGIRNT